MRQPSTLNTIFAGGGLRPGWPFPPLPAHGFTLIEMAVVLAIIGLVLGALLVPLSTQMDAARYATARVQIDDAEQALLGWAVINGRLPCPDTTGDGLPDPPGGPLAPTLPCTTSDEGFLPYAALGVERLDPWGNRLRYRADRAFTTTFGLPYPPDTVIMPTPPSPAPVVSIAVVTRLGAALSAPTPSAPAFLIFSCGKNGSADAANNGNTTLVATDRCGVPTSPMDVTYTQDVFTDDVFDDLLVFYSRFTLVERMTRAGVWPR